MNPEKRRINKVILRTGWSLSIAFSVITIFGYLSTLNITPPVIVTRPFVGIPYFQLIAQVAVVIMLSVKGLLLAMPFKLNLHTLITGNAEVSKKANVMICVLFWVVCCTVSIVFPNVEAVLGIFGGFCSVNICYLIPLYIYIKLRKDSIYSLKNVSAIMYFSILSIAGWVGIAASI
jgi:hypothetical protein